MSASHATLSLKPGVSMGAHSVVVTAVSAAKLFTCFNFFFSEGVSNLKGYYLLYYATALHIKVNII